VLVVAELIIYSYYMIFITEQFDMNISVKTVKTGTFNDKKSTYV